MRSLVSLSFDDGRKDQYNTAMNILYKMNMPATFNITTGYVDGTCPASFSPTSIAPLTINDINEMHNTRLFEIAIHGNNHLNSIDDIMEGKVKLCKWLGMHESTLFGFASPGSNIDINNFTNREYEILKNNVCYIRTSYRLIRNKKIRVLSRKAARILHFPFLYLLAYKDTLLCSTDGMVLYSVPVMKDTTVAEIKYLVQYAARIGFSVILMFHSIDNGNIFDHEWTWKESKFIKLCGYLASERNAGNLEVCTTKDLFFSLKQ